jgi:hypothetical protein
MSEIRARRGAWGWGWGRGFLRHLKSSRLRKRGFAPRSELDGAS